MVISIINGGFANQLYRYACAYATAKKYNQKLIIIAQTTNVGTDPFQLGEFKIEYSELYIVENHIQKAMLLEQWKKRYRLKEVKESEYLSVMSSEVFSQYEGIILYGTYQNAVFFEEYIEELRSIFYFEKETFFLTKFKEEIANKQSVAIHVRRGDFLTYDALCHEMEFYKAAMCTMEDKIGYGQAEYYIFSDDKAFARSYFGRNKRIHVVQVYGDYREAVEEFLALSLCSHRILTVASSFSRMADALNTNQSGYTIYEYSGFCGMVYPRKNIIYLDQQMIAALAGYYVPLFERDLVPEKGMSGKEILNLDMSGLTKFSIDSKDVKEESELIFRIRKIELLSDAEQYAEALGQARKLWEMAFETEWEDRTHELYWKCLYKFGYRAESMIEATFLLDRHDELAQYYDLKELNLIKKLRNSTKNLEVLIVPARSFDPCEFEDMVHIGMILRRLGHQVTFMFWEPEPESAYYQPYSKTLREGHFFEDVMGHNSQCRMINLTEREKEFGSIQVFFDNYFRNQERVILMAKQKKIISAAKESNFSKRITTVFWDYTNIFDLGSYKGLNPQNYGIGVCKQEIAEKEVAECYEISDYCITSDKRHQVKKSVVMIKEDWQKFFDLKKCRLVADYYRIAPEMLENAFDIILQIINRCMPNGESEGDK